MADKLKELVAVLNREREAYPSIADMAAAANVPYDTLYALLNGTRVRGVNIDMLSALAQHFPAVAALFLPLDLQIRNDIIANPQEVSA